jgi:hypothetical protein
MSKLVPVLITAGLALGLLPGYAVAQTASKPAQAAATSSLCEGGPGDPALSRELVVAADAALTTARRDLYWLHAGYARATTASPAALRMHEEIDQLDSETKDLDELRDVAVVQGGATPASPAQFRAQEELGSICDRLGV